MKSLTTPEWYDDNGNLVKGVGYDPSTSQDGQERILCTGVNGSKKAFWKLNSMVKVGYAGGIGGDSTNIGGASTPVYIRNGDFRTCENLFYESYLFEYEPDQYSNYQQIYCSILRHRYIGPSEQINNLSDLLYYGMSQKQQFVRFEAFGVTPTSGSIFPSNSQIICAGRDDESTRDTQIEILYKMTDAPGGVTKINFGKLVGNGENILSQFTLKSPGGVSFAVNSSTRIR